MFERFTQRAIDTIVNAQEESKQQGHNYVAPEQLLLGIMMTGGGIAHEALTSSGVKVKELREEIRNLVPDAQDAIEVEMPFTPVGKIVLELTWDEARKAQHAHIGDEHLLLAILRHNDNIGAQALRNLDIDLAELAQSVESQVKSRI